MNDDVIVDMFQDNVSSNEDVSDARTRFFQNIVAELNQLKQQYNDVIQESQTTRRHLNEELVEMHEENKDLHDENDRLYAENQDLIVRNHLVEEELSTSQFDLRNVNFEMNVLQVDWFNEKEANKELIDNLQEQKRQFLALQQEVCEADRTNTKRNNRLVLTIEELTEENKKLQTQMDTIENELEKLELLCHVCKAGVKMIKCDQCNEKVCISCYNHLDSCPFCRNSLLI